jgi:hypothetical protein
VCIRAKRNYQERVAGVIENVAEKQEVRNVPFRRHCWERKIDHIGMMADIELHEKFGIDKSDAKKEVRNVPFRRRC